MLTSRPRDAGTDMPRTGAYPVRPPALPRVIRPGWIARGQSGPARHRRGQGRQLDKDGGVTRANPAGIWGVLVCLTRAGVFGIQDSLMTRIRAPAETTSRTAW